MVSSETAQHVDMILNDIARVKNELRLLNRLALSRKGRREVKRLRRELGELERDAKEHKATLKRFAKGHVSQP